MFFTLFYQPHRRNVFLNVYCCRFFIRPCHRMPLSPPTRLALWPPGCDSTLRLQKSEILFILLLFSVLFYALLYNLQKYRMFAYLHVSILRVLLPLLLFRGGWRLFFCRPYTPEQPAGPLIPGGYGPSLPFLYLPLI